MSLFVLASKDGWVNIMYSGLDAVGVDLQVCTSYHQQLSSKDSCLCAALSNATAKFSHAFTFIFQWYIAR